MIRSAIVKIIRPCGRISYIERIVINDKNRVVYHGGFGGIIDEGEKGTPFEQIYNFVIKVEFTGRIYEQHGTKYEVVEIYSRLPMESSDKALQDFEVDPVHYVSVP